MKMVGKPICAVDVETSGLFPSNGDRVIECAAVIIKNREIHSEFHTLINAPCKIKHDAHRIHGITQQMLLSAPSPGEAWSVFSKFIGDLPLLAHNAQFDQGFIRCEFLRLGLRISNHFTCTLARARKRFPSLPNHRLETVARHVLGKIPKECQLHRALGDARLVARVWMDMEEM